MLGDGLAILAIPLLVLQLSRSPLLAVLASLPGSVGYLAAGLPAGVFADRVDPWHVLIAADLIRAVTFVTLFACTGSGATPPWLILSLAFAAGAITVFADTALAIAVRDVFTGSRLISANSWLESANQCGLIIGPSAAGLLAAAGLLRVSMLIDALTFVISLSTLACRRPYRNSQLPARRPASAGVLARELSDGLRYLGATRLLLTLLCFMLVLNLCLGADKLVIFLARTTMQLPAGAVGLVVAAGGVGGLAGAAGTKLLIARAGPVPAVVLSSSASGVALVLIAAATSLPVLAIGNMSYTAAIIAASVTMRALRQVLVPRELLGRVTASWRLGGQAVTLAGALVAGVLASLCGGDPRPVIAGAGFVTLLTVAIAWLAGLRRQDASDAAGALLQQ